MARSYFVGITEDHRLLVNSQPLSPSGIREGDSEAALAWALERVSEAATTQEIVVHVTDRRDNGYGSHAVRLVEGGSISLADLHAAAGHSYGEPPVVATEGTEGANVTDDHLPVEDGPKVGAVAEAVSETVSPGEPMTEGGSDPEPAVEPEANLRPEPEVEMGPGVEVQDGSGGEVEDGFTPDPEGEIDAPPEIEVDQSESTTHDVEGVFVDGAEPITPTDIDSATEAASLAMLDDGWTSPKVVPPVPTDSDAQVSIGQEESEQWDDAPLTPSDTSLPAVSDDLAADLKSSLAAAAAIAAASALAAESAQGSPTTEVGDASPKLAPEPTRESRADARERKRAEDEAKREAKRAEAQAEKDRKAAEKDRKAAAIQAEKDRKEAARQAEKDRKVAERQAEKDRKEAARARGGRPLVADVAVEQKPRDGWMKYTPCVAPPSIPDNPSTKPRRSAWKLWVAVGAILLTILGVKAYVVNSPNTYVAVCVDNRTMIREASDANCERSAAVYHRWFYVQMGASLPAVNEQVDPAQGSTVTPKSDATIVYGFSSDGGVVGK